MRNSIRKNSILSGVATLTGLSVLAVVGALAPRLAAGTLESAAAPRQVQVKFEWVAAAAGPGGNDKSVEALTLVAQEGRTARVSSQHIQNGVGAQETVSVLPRLDKEGMISLDISERTDDTAHGETKSDSSQTTVRVKAGQTALVRGLVKTQGGQDAQRMLFVTPVVVQAVQ